MEVKNIKNRLKKCQPYFIEKELLPNLYFREDFEETERWVFIYTFLRRLSDTSIGIRLDYSSANIHYITKRIIMMNQTLIENFLTTHNI